MTAKVPATFLMRVLRPVLDATSRCFVSALTILMAGAALFIMAAPARSATVVGNIQDVSQQPYGGLVNILQFTPLNCPQQIGTNTIWPVPKRVCLTNGMFSVNLVGGYYYVGLIEGLAPLTPKTVKILVPPNDTNVWQFNDCATLATNLGTFVWTNTPTIVGTFDFLALSNTESVLLNSSRVEWTQIDDGHNSSAVPGGGGNNGVQFCYRSNGSNDGVAIGPLANGFNFGIAIGESTYAANQGVSVGANSGGSDAGASVGYGTSSSGLGVAVGAFAIGDGEGNVAIGGGNLSDAAPRSMIPGGMTHTAEIGGGTATKNGALHYHGFPISNTNGVPIGVNTNGTRFLIYVNTATNGFTFVPLP